MTADLHALAAAYALDALDDDERAEFGRHLDSCPDCSQDVRDFRATAARLGAAVEEPPSAALRARVLDEVDRTRQESPLRMVPRSRLARAARAPLTVAAAVLLVVSGVLLAVALRQHQDAERITATASRIARVVGDPDAARATPAAERGGRAVLTRSGSELVVSVSALPALPSGRAYQLWVVRGDAARSAGLLPDGGPVLVPEVRDGDKVGITVEPATGSEAPTTPPVLLAPVPA